jgi:hypothetical protein
MKKMMKKKSKSLGMSKMSKQPLKYEFVRQKKIEEAK